MMTPEEMEAYLASLARPYKAEDDIGLPEGFSVPLIGWNEEELSALDKFVQESAPSQRKANAQQARELQQRLEEQYAATEAAEKKRKSVEQKHGQEKKKVHLAVQMQRSAENLQHKAEQAQKASEQARKEAERAQKTAEQAQKKAEQAQRKAERDKKAADQGKLSVEKEVARLKQLQHPPAAVGAGAPAAVLAPAARPCAVAIQQLLYHLKDELIRKQNELIRKQDELIRKQAAQAAAQAAQAAAQAAAPTAASVPSSAAPPLVKWIKQINTSYNTIREVKYDWTTKKFQFNSGKASPNNHNASDAWVDITDAATITLLNTLGSWSAKQGRFNPTVGQTTVYTRGSHSYQVEVVKECYPWSAQGGAAAPPAAAAGAAPSAAAGVPSAAAGVPAAAAAPIPTFGPGSIGFKMTLDNATACIPLSPAVVQTWLNHMRTDDSDPYKLSNQIISGIFTDLARLWSSFSQNFNYDSSLSAVWVKPHWFKTWCSIYIARQFHTVRLVAHGASAANYEKMFKDPVGPCTAFASGGCRHGVGHYVSLCDGVAADYSAQHGCKDGTFMLELLMENSHQSQIKPSSMWREYYIGTCNRANYHGSSGSNDARNVYDTSIVLPLGVAVSR